MGVEMVRTVELTMAKFVVLFDLLQILENVDSVDVSDSETVVTPFVAEDDQMAIQTAIRTALVRVAVAVTSQRVGIP